MYFQLLSSIRTFLSNAFLLHRSHCASVKCLHIAKPTVSQPREHLHLQRQTQQSCGHTMSKRILYSPVHSACFCTGRKGLKEWQKIPLESQLLFYNRRSLPLICFKDKAGSSYSLPETKQTWVVPQHYNLACCIFLSMVPLLAFTVDYGSTILKLQRMC